jgi:hypothetical protein
MTFRKVFLLLPFRGIGDLLLSARQLLPVLLITTSACGHGELIAYNTFMGGLLCGGMAVVLTSASHDAEYDDDGKDVSDLESKNLSAGTTAAAVCGGLALVGTSIYAIAVGDEEEAMRLRLAESAQVAAMEKKESERILAAQAAEAARKEEEEDRRLEEEDGRRMERYYKEMNSNEALRAMQEP